MRKADMIAGAGLFALALLMVLVIIPSETAEGQWSGLSPYFYPVLMSSGIAVFSLALLVQAVGRRQEDEPDPLPIGWRQLAMFVLVGVAILAGVLAIDFFGIWIGGPALIVMVMLFMGERSPLIVVPTATVPIVAVYLLVNHVLNAPLP